MPIFAYRSTTMEGAVSEGVIDAPDKKAAIERLRNTGVIPLEVKAPADQGFRRRIGFLRPQGGSGVIYGRALHTAGGGTYPRNGAQCPFRNIRTEGD